MIYFIQRGEHGPIKIGFASDPEQRLLQLQTGNAEPLRLLGVIEGDQGKEAQLHYRFKPLHIRGEWFHPADSLLDYIATQTGTSLKNQNSHTNVSQSVVKRNNQNLSEPLHELWLFGLLLSNYIAANWLAPWIVVNPSYWDKLGVGLVWMYAYLLVSKVVTAYMADRKRIQ